MNDLFQPENLDDSIDNLLSKTYGFSGDNTLVVSIHNMIFALPDSGSRPVLIAGREDEVNGLCIHKGRLLDCGKYDNIYETLSQKKIYRQTKKHVQAMISREEELFFSYEGFIVGNETLYGVRENNVKDFCVREDKTLMDCGDYGLILNTLKDNFLLKTGFSVRAMCEFEEELYFGGKSGVYKFQSTNEQIGDLSDIWALCEHNNRIYCSNHDNITDVLSEEVIFHSKQGAMTSMVSVPTWMILSHLK